MHPDRLFSGGLLELCVLGLTSVSALTSATNITSAADGASGAGIALVSFGAAEVRAPLPLSAAELRKLSQAARSIVGRDQGVYVEAADRTILVAQRSDLAVHPASVSKLPTTLALLRKLGPEHRFVTTFSSAGQIVNGALTGDLIVENDGDPSLVDEDAVLIADRLNESGVESVTGSLLPRTPMIFDWQNDDDGVRLRQALSGLISPQAWASVSSLATTVRNPPGGVLAPPRVRFAAAPALPATDIVRLGISDLGGLRPLVVHRSQPLLSLIKSLNDYSNNVFKPLAEAAGGAAAVENVARSALPQEMRSEVVLGDGAGTDPRNRLSPRAAVKLLRALEAEAMSTAHTLTDILPVAGIDEGTLRQRLNGPGEAGCLVGKTGTYGSYGASALVGAISSVRYGTVYFAILNHGIAVPRARQRQDRFARVLLKALRARPWPYDPDLRPAIVRAQVLPAPQLEVLPPPQADALPASQPQVAPAPQPEPPPAPR